MIWTLLTLPLLLSAATKLPLRVRSLEPPLPPKLNCSLPETPIKNVTCPPEQICVPPTVYNASNEITGDIGYSLNPYWGTCIGASCDPFGPPQPCPFGQKCLHFEDPELHLPGKCVLEEFNEADGEGGACRMNTTITAGVEDKGGVEDCWGDIMEWSCVVDKNTGCTEMDEVDMEDWVRVGIDWSTMCWGLCMPKKWENCFEEGRWPGCH